MTNFLLKKNDKVHQTAKNKNKKAGFLLGRVSFITGNNSIINAADAQFTIVANGRTFGCTISGKYTHTTGPRVNPKLAMNRTNPKIIITKATPASRLCRKNPQAMTPHPTQHIAEPTCSNAFLPMTVNKYDVNMAAITCSKFIRIGTISLRVGLLPPTISPP